MITYPATAIALQGRAVLFEGESGAGKSDLAFRLIQRGATLISDDYVNLETSGGRLLASPPPEIAGKLEIRGIGIEEFEFIRDIPVALLVRLLPRDKIERMPKPDVKTIEGVKIKQFKLHAFDASSPEKVAYLLEKI